MCYGRFGFVGRFACVGVWAWLLLGPGCFERACLGLGYWGGGGECVALLVCREYGF